jgi:outer membrane receptor protein involved in Fe transport
MKTILPGLACVATLGFSIATAQAQTTSPASDAQGSAQAPSSSQVKAASSQLEEIVVTATRRPERLQDVPLSVTAYSQEQLNEKGIVGYEGLAAQTPGVVLNKQSDNFNNFTARGIATNSYGANLQSTVAIYIDELPISTIGNTTTLNPNLYDVERVEFLRGPQGTLFGSGSLSGALRILTKSPDLTRFEASTQIDYGVTGSGWDSLRQRYDGMINLPLVSDVLALRIVGFYRHEDGWIDNIGTGIKDSNTLEDGGARATLLYKPTERLSAKLLISYEDSVPKDASLTSPSLGLYTRDSNEPDVYSGKLTNYNATINYQFDGANFTSSTTYSRFDQNFIVDLAGTFGGLIPFGLNDVGFQRTFVEEARLASDPGGKFDWVVGLFDLNRRIHIDSYLRSSLDFLSNQGITGLPNQFFQADFTHVDSSELAGFGDLTYHINDQFWVTGGLRYGRVAAQGFDDGGGYSSNYFVNALFGISGPLTLTPTVAGSGLKAEASKASYKGSVSYKPTSNLTTYATVSTGFRSPVINAQAGQASPVNPKDIIIPSGASSDNLKNYELGAKSSWLNGRLYANVALYYIDWRNIQVQANRVSDSIQFATNIGAAKSKGLELEITAIPFTGLTIGLNGSYNHARVTQVSAEEAAISGAVAGARLSAPIMQGALNIDYAFDLSSRVKAAWSGSLQHVGSFPNSFPDVPGQPGVTSATYGYTDTYNTVNTNFRLAIDRRLTVAAYCENVFDSAAIVYVHPEAFVASRYGRLQPRTIGVRMGYDF